MGENLMASESTVLTKVAPHNPAVVTLGATVEELADHYKRYEEVKTKLLVPTDYVVIANKKCIAKPGWMKLGVAFNLTTEIVRQQRTTNAPNEPPFVRWEIDIKCIAPNGRVVEECGLCDNLEEKQIGSPEHKIKSMAVTRATERAYIKMLGAPDTAADDMPDSLERTDVPTNQETRPEVCHCSFTEMEPNPVTGKDDNCGKPYTAKQFEAWRKLQ